jgi:hypothetical protein
MFLAPPLSLAERVARSVFVAARARAIPFALLSARLAVDLAREESATSVLRGRGPLAYAAALVAFLMDCERLHRFSAADVWENAHAHLATVALQGVLTKAVERSARAFRDVSENAYVADPMAGWVHFAHDVLNFPHLMTLCYGFLCVDADRAPAVAAVRGMRTRVGAARRARDAEGRLEKSVAALLEALGLFDGGADRTGVVAGDASRAHGDRAVARARDRRGGGDSVVDGVRDGDEYVEGRGALGRALVRGLFRPELVRRGERT